MKTLLAVLTLTIAAGCAGTHTAAPNTLPPATVATNATAPSVTTTPAEASSPASTFELADLQNTRAIFAADLSLVDPKTGVNYGVVCADRLIEHQPELAALFAPLAPLPSFTPAASVIGPFSAVAALKVKADIALTYEQTLAASVAARQATIRAGIPLDVHAACAMFATDAAQMLAKFGINLPRLGVR